MKKIVKITLSAILAVITVFSLVACSTPYEVDMGIGSGNVENDRVSAKYAIDEVIYDGYVLEVTFSAEKSADLSGKFVFGITTNTTQELYSDNYSENVLATVKGEDIKDGKTFTVKIELNKLTELLKEEKGEFKLLFHCEDSRPSDITKYSTSDYSYEKDGEKIRITK